MLVVATTPAPKRDVRHWTTVETARTRSRWLAWLNGGGTTTSFRKPAAFNHLLSLSSHHLLTLIAVAQAARDGVRLYHDCSARAWRRKESEP